MSYSKSVLCPEWAVKLSDLHSHDLSPSDQAALETHLASCQTCAAVLREYQRMDDRIHQVLSSNTLPGFTPELLRTREAASQKHWKSAQEIQQEHHNFELGRRGILRPFVLVLLLCFVGGVSILAFASRSTGSPPVAHTVTPARTPSIAAPTGNVGAYPQFATSYAGTISDLLSGQKTALFLTNVKQSGGNIQGHYQGLGQVGTFKGTVSADDHVHFTVSIWGGNETLSFEGTIKVGGDMVGEFYALDPNGNKLGESGIWDAGPHP